MISKAEAILAIKSDAQVSTDQDNKVIWHDENPTNITDKQIEDKQKELQIEGYLLTGRYQKPQR